jgi:hypothetical protein
MRDGEEHAATDESPNPNPDARRRVGWIGWGGVDAIAERAAGSTPGIATGLHHRCGAQRQRSEAGVWVIAETKDLPTPFTKIVVTDDRGRFMLPELPGANYSVWVRGYGLVDSPKVQAKPGATSLTLLATPARTPQEAAKVYPGNYWLSLMEPPATHEFPGNGGNGLGAAMLTQNHWINSLKSDCNFCHQLGNQLTRSVDHIFKAKPELKSHEEAWEWRLGTGVRGTAMYSVLTNQGKVRPLRTFADWTQRVAKGEVPPAPPRPTGQERNVVVTLWDWGTDHSFMHDEVATDKRHPTVNAYGPIYAVSAGHGTLVILDPLDEPYRRNRDSDARATRGRALTVSETESSFAVVGRHASVGNPPYNPADPHNPMLDSKGRVWITSKIRPNQDPSWCSDPANRYAAWYPLRNSGRQASVYDPKTKQFTLIDTCYSTHHLQFDNDANETVYFNELTGPIFGWIDTKIFDETKDEQKAVGWCGQVVDTNGDGRITRPWNRVTGRGESILYQGDTATGGTTTGGRGGGVDPSLDTEVDFNLYSAVPSPVDNAIWGVSERFPGYLVRVDRGTNPPESCQAEIFRVPEPGFDPRGVDVDTNGVVWTALAASSHLASFDRRKCKGSIGHKIDGSECREGWTLYQTNGPKLKGHRHSLPTSTISTGSTARDSRALARTSRWQRDRIRFTARARSADARMDHDARPYPLGFYSRGMDGRIDDPNAGWKGTRTLRELRDALRLAHRRWKGHQGKAGQVPASSRSARAMNRRSTCLMEIRT